MFSIKFPCPGIFSGIFSLKFLACVGLKNFPGSQKYDAKHWGSVIHYQLGQALLKRNRL
jgi:hypothetical protein